MIKRKLLLVLCVIFSTTGFSQEHNHDHIEPCGEAQLRNAFLENASPADLQRYQESRTELENFTQQFIANQQNASDNADRSVIYTIPVVFHIVHENGSENISNAQVENAMFIMNRDYQKLNSDTISVVTPFKPIVADIQVEFKLAKRDPNGNCTNGITRTFSTFSNDPNAGGNDRINAVIAQHGVWPGDEYLNIFIAGEIGGAAGYTYLPSNWLGGSMGNGIHVLDTYVGAIGTSSVGRSRTLTHEVGHWLNLSHLWGGTNNPDDPANCNDDDGVADTPNTVGWTVCDLNGTTCDGNLDNVQNYMEYSYCSRMFTEGQKSRMHAALNSSIGGRNNIWSPSNLIATGVNEPDQLCKAEFGANEFEICAGSEIQFTDFSYTGPTQWTWSFPGGTPATSTAQNPAVIYNTPGTYAVTLTAGDGTNSDTETKTNYITVLSNIGSLPYLETFEDNIGIPDAEWSEVNNGGASWTIAQNVSGASGNRAAKMPNFGMPSGSVDDLISQSMDLSGVDPNEGVTLSFKYAYKKRNSGNNETLKVFISRNCGETWAQRKTISGDNLGSEVQSNAFTPSSEDDWVTVHMTNVTSTYWTEGFRTRFSFEGDGGNNIYIDDINIYYGSPSDELVALEEENLVSDFSVFPNPNEGDFNIRFNTLNNTLAKITLVNMVGQTIATRNVQANAGMNLVQFGEQGLEAGAYFVNIVVNGATQTKQLIIK